MPEAFDIELSKRLVQFQHVVDDGYLPFLEEETSLIEVLTEEDNGDANFYDDFLNFRKTKIEIQQKFQFPDYNYLSRKTEIENYNALELASQIDSRVIEFADNYKNDAKTLAQIIAQKKKFPREKFDLLKESFPCMICSLRDYAEYIPLARELSIS